MTQKTILITGSTAGIGLAGAEALGRQGWRVLVHARTAARGQPLVDDLVRRIPMGHFDLVTGDLSDLDQVKALADQTMTLTDRLDVLWNNAGLMTTVGQSSAQGFELQWAVNHLAPFLLTSRLLPLVQAARQGRVIQTASFAHHIGKVPADGSGFSRGAGRYRGYKVYGDTKLANILFIRELARRTGGTKVTAHSFHPGYVRTTIGSNGDQSRGNAASWLAFAQIPVEQGAETGVFLATHEQAAAVSGVYWSSKRPRRGSWSITDGNAARLWDLTEGVLEAR